MDILFYAIYCLAYLILFIWGIDLSRKYHWSMSANVILIVVAALFYDNLVLASGRWIGEGTFLENLNAVRYWLHALITPLLVVFSWNLLKNPDLSWPQKNATKLLVFVIVIGLILLELFTVVLGLKLEPHWNFGVLSYRSRGSGIPWMVMIVSAILLITSIILWRKQKWPWLFVSVVLMAIGGILEAKVQSDASMNGFELILMISLLTTKQFQGRK